MTRHNHHSHSNRPRHPDPHPHSQEQEQGHQQEGTRWLKRVLSAPPPRHSMTSMQEAANAATMLLPVLVCWAYLARPHRPPTDHLAFLVSLGTTAHLPASVSYHLSCMLGRPNETLKKLDFTLIHTASVCYSFATSASLAYAAMNLAWNIYALHIVWGNTGWRKAERTRGVLISVGLYTLPMALRADTATYLGAVGSFLLAGGIYFLNSVFKGWDHAIFHALLPCFQYHMLLGASHAYQDNQAYVDSLLSGIGLI